MALTAATLSGAAQAQAAFTATAVHLRAGPAPDYPVVAVLPPGYQIAVQGCLSDYSWCDVLAGPERGWIYAANISYPYQNTYVPVLTYGAVIGIGILAFVLNDYWPHYYHDRPWYADRHRWEGRPAPRPHDGRQFQPLEPPRPRLPTPPGFVGPGRQLNPPAQNVGPGGGRPSGQHEREPSRARPSPPQRVGPGEQHPGRPQAAPQGGQRNERRDERRDERHGDR